MTNFPSFVKSAEPARLIPVVSDSSGEQRSTSVVLATMRGVYEFRKELLESIGVRVGKRSKLHTWTEVTFAEKEKNKKKGRPDGLIIHDTGKGQWKALVEAKAGNSEIDEDQLHDYMKKAKEHGIDAVITISNQFVAMPSHHPVKVSRKLPKGVELYHWSWMYILTQATLLLEADDIDSPDQQFLMDEFVRYLSHSKSGIARFGRMNSEWKDVVSKVKSNAPLNKNSEEVGNTVTSWHQEQRDLCLVMSRRLGRPVKLNIGRKHRKDPRKRLQDDTAEFVKSKRLECEINIPDTAAPISISADLTTRTITCSMRLDAPQDKKSTSARANWLVRQLSGVNPEDIYLKAIRAGRAEDTQARLRDVMQDAKVLESPNTDVTPSAFEVFYMLDLAGKFSGNEVFIKKLEEAVPYFYEQAGQRLRAWVAPPPKIRKGDPAEPRRDEAREEVSVEEKGIGVGEDLEAGKVGFGANESSNPNGRSEA